MSVVKEVYNLIFRTHACMHGNSPLPGKAPTPTTRLLLLNEAIDVAASLSAMTVVHGGLELYEVRVSANRVCVWTESKLIGCRLVEIRWLPLSLTYHTHSSNKTLVQVCGIGAGPLAGGRGQGAAVGQDAGHQQAHRPGN